MPTHVALLRGIYIQSGNVVFTSEEPTRGPWPGRWSAPSATGWGCGPRVVVLSREDLARVVGTTLYLHTPDGFGRSELAAQLTKAGPVGTAATARNWATVRKLLDMCGS
jgi:uncharacterized protein (DUF1697 family)